MFTLFKLGVIKMHTLGTTAFMGHRFLRRGVWWSDSCRNCCKRNGGNWNRNGCESRDKDEG